MENATAGDKKFRRLSEFYSFALPGLGQVYQRRYSAGAVFFFSFIAFITISPDYHLLPLLALVAGLETRRFRAASDTAGALAQLAWSKKFEDKYAPRLNKARIPIFTFVGSLGLAAWMTLFAPNLFPMQTQWKLNNQSEQLAGHVKRFRGQKGKLPVAWEACLPEAQRKLAVDPWGTVFRLTLDVDGFEIRSAGKDKTFGTVDDFSYHFR